MHQPVVNPEPYAVGLPHFGFRAEVIACLPQHNARHHRAHKQRDHRPDVGIGAGADGFVDEHFAEPHHRKRARHIEQTEQDLRGHVEADAGGVNPYPADVF